MPIEAEWSRVYIRELTGFPGVRYDDRIEATTRALKFLGAKGFYGAMWAKLGSI